jgi:hypothetical protein
MGKQMLTMKNEMVGPPFLESDDLVQSVDQNMCERWRSTISELSCEFTHISRAVLYEIITVRLCYHHKFWVS